MTRKVNRARIAPIGPALTIENRASKVGQEFDEHVLLLGGEFVPSGPPTTALDFAAGQTLVDIGFDPIVGDDEISCIFFPGEPSPRCPPLLLLLGQVIVGGGYDRFPSSVAVGGDIPHQSGIFIELLKLLRVESNLLVGVAILQVGVSTLLRHCERGDGGKSTMLGEGGLQRRSDGGGGKRGGNKGNGNGREMRGFR